MKKYPWEDGIEIDWNQDWPKILEAYMDKYFGASEKLIEHYFKAKMWKSAAIAGWAVSATLLYCLMVVTP